jgi:hypothetical protein
MSKFFIKVSDIGLLLSPPTSRTTNLALSESDSLTHSGISLCKSKMSAYLTASYQLCGIVWNAWFAPADKMIEFSPSG